MPNPRCGHVQAEHVAAGLPRRLIVEPALDHDEKAGKTEADRDPQDQPRPWRDGERVNQSRAGGDCGKGGEGPDVPEASDDARQEQAADHEAGVVKGTEAADGDGREARKLALDGHQHAEQAIAELEQNRGDQQIEEGDEHRDVEVHWRGQGGLAGRTGARPHVDCKSAVWSERVRRLVSAVTARLRARLAKRGPPSRACAPPLARPRWRNSCPNRSAAPA